MKKRNNISIGNNNGILHLVIYLLRSNKRDYDESDRPSSKLGPVIPPDVNYTTGGNKKV
jgi:hypothetical protein